jgi:integrase
MVSFFAWCRARGHMTRDADPLEGVKKFKVPEKPRVLIPQAEFSTFLAGITDPRHRAIAALGLYTFAGVSEIRRLRWQDDLGDHLLVIRDKTGIVDEKPICEELREELDNWKRAYAVTMGEPVKKGWLIIPGVTGGTYGKGRVRSPVKYDPGRKAAVGGTMKDILERAGYYQPHEGGHTLRRSGARALYDQLSSVGHDRSIRIVQAMLGHASLSNTEIYLRLSADRKVRDDLLAGRRMFPAQGEAQVIRFQERRDGTTNTRGDRV